MPSGSGEMTSIISDVGQVVTAGMGWLGEAATEVTETPLLLLFCVVGFIGTGIGLMRRIIG